VQENIPGLRQGLPQQVDVLGRPVANPLQGLGELLPARAAAGQSTPLLQAYMAAQTAPGAAPSTIPYGSTGGDIRLTPQERQQFTVYRGQVIQQATDRLVSTPQWQQMGQKQQQIALQNVDQNAQAAAGRMLLRDIGPTASARAEYTSGRLAPVIGYSPDVMANQLAMQQQRAQHAALLQSLLA
jgi:hypothetical protein